MLAYSKKLFEAGQAGGLDTKRLSAFAEKAVLTNAGDIVVFFLVCDISDDAVWSHSQKPTYILSSDGGHTWSEPAELGNKRGRVYDARNYNGAILALHFAKGNDINFLGNKEEHVYELYVSDDGGRTFGKRSDLPFDTNGKSYGTMGMLDSGQIVVYIYNSNDERASDYVVSDDGGRTFGKRSDLPFDTNGKSYGTMGMLDSGQLVVYIYNRNDEQASDYAVSDDGGYSWSAPKTAHLAKKIRNPQLVSLNGCYFMHGRSGSLGEEKGHMVLYSSRNGLDWDAGVYLRKRTAGLRAYSNSIVVGALKPNSPQQVLIQASHAYEQHKTNVLHWWLDMTRQGR